MDNIFIIRTYYANKNYNLLSNGSIKKISHKNKIYKCNWINKLHRNTGRIVAFSVSYEMRNLPEVVDEEVLNEIPVEYLTVQTGQEKQFL